MSGSAHDLCLGGSFSSDVKNWPIAIGLNNGNNWPNSGRRVWYLRIDKLPFGGFAFLEAI
jgi:hypothetical protein